MLKVVNEKKLSCVAQRIAEGMSAIVTQSGCQELLTAFRFVILHLAPRASGLPSVDGRQTLMIAEIGLAEKGLPKKAYFFHPPTTPLSFSWPGFPKLFYFCPKKKENWEVRPNAPHSWQSPLIRLFRLFLSFTPPSSLLLKRMDTIRGNPLRKFVQLCDKAWRDGKKKKTTKNTTPCPMGALQVVVTSALRRASLMSMESRQHSASASLPRRNGPRT
jgi:hypothetical protein